jgi:uncharacterized membrane protein
MKNPSVPHVEYLPTILPEIRRVQSTASLQWLRLGLADLRQAWSVSLAYGVLFAGLGWALVTHGWSDSHFAIAFTSGFLMLAPVLAICFYAISRALQRHEPAVSLTRPFHILRDNGWSIGLFAIMLAMLFSLWERVTAIMVALTLKADVYAGDSFSYTESILFDPEHLPVVIGFFAIGGLFALIAFVLSAVSLPMIVDRRADPVTALLTSLAAVRRNPLALLIWAAVIAGLTGLGFLTGFIGLIVIFPLLGHATWHAYRELVVEAEEGHLKHAMSDRTE